MRPLNVRHALKHKSILVTGATGFLGQTWLSMLLHKVPDVGRVWVVVRGKTKARARKRFENLLNTSPAFRPVRADCPSVSTKIHVLTGDVSQPGFGLDGAVLDALRGQVDLVVHFAGETAFDPEPEQALSANINGALNAAEIAVRCAGGRLIHISTCFVAGNGAGMCCEQSASTQGFCVSPNGTRFNASEEIVWLDELCSDVRLRAEPKFKLQRACGRAQQLGWPNLYTYTKALSEFALQRRSDLDLTVVRPSIVECAEHYPFPGWNQGVNTSAPLVWLLGSIFRGLPARAHIHFDVVPVDAVARAVLCVAAAKLQGCASDIYQVASSGENPFTMGRAIELTALGVREHYGRQGANTFERWVLRHLDAVPADLNRRAFPSLDTQREVVRRARRLLSKIPPSLGLPPALAKHVSPILGRKLFRTAKFAKELERWFSRTQELLRLYKPFIYDNDWVFRSDNLRALTASLDARERAEFAAAIDQIDWHQYWLDVEIPGLMKWCLPLLRGERIPSDDAPTTPLHVAADIDVPQYAGEELLQTA